MFDYLIFGAGFAGSVLAERLANTLNSRKRERGLWCCQRPLCHTYTLLSILNN
jgi:hypothetical protein